MDRPNPPPKSPVTDPMFAPDAASHPSTELPTISFAADGCVMGQLRGVAVAVWAVQSSVVLAAELEKLVTQLGETHKKFSSIQLVISKVPMPPAEVRAKLAAIAARLHDRLACSATLLLGSGFWASAVRGVVTSIQVIEQRRGRERVFSNLEELAAWVAPIHSAESGATIERDQLAHALRWFLDQPTVRGRADS